MKIKRIKFQNYTVFEDQQMSNTTNIRIYNIICCLRDVG